MKQLFGILLIPFFSVPLLAQKETFDLAIYSPLKGWQKQKSDNMIQFSKQDEAKGIYCIISLYKAFDATDDPKKNFSLAWESLVKETFNTEDAPAMQDLVKDDNWQVESGYATFKTDETSGVALLVTSSGYNKMVNILILTNTEAFEKEITAFLESVDLKKQGTEKPAPKEIDNANKKAIKNDGYAFTTTNFDNGWVSVIKEDWVEVTKEKIKVYLFYALSYNASDFSGTGVVDRDYYWDNHVSKYFTIQTKMYPDNSEVMSSFKPDYVEGWAIDKQTGEKVFIAMTLSIAPNLAYINVATAPDEASIRSQFPKANDKYSSDLKAMSGYNKFAVGKNDLTGKWSNSSGATMSWYSATTGNNVGATGVAKGDVFNFNSNGTYTSIHNGATGWVGSMNTYQQNYKGQFSITNWLLSITNRWDGKTEKFEAWFEVGKGGRQLHLTIPGGGMSYNLFKEK